MYADQPGSLHDAPHVRGTEVAIVAIEPLHRLLRAADGQITDHRAPPGSEDARQLVTGPLGIVEVVPDCGADRTIHRGIGQGERHAVGEDRLEAVGEPVAQRIVLQRPTDWAGRMAQARRLAGLDPG